jgi:DNA processing protein
MASQIREANVLAKAEAELTFALRNRIQVLCLTDEAYPTRLRTCDDAPPVLYYRGSASLNPQFALSVVGTRNATHYGRDFTENMVAALAPKQNNVVVISGLAYGIDAAAHKAALTHHLPTVGVLAHGFRTLYPAAHRDLAGKILQNGGLLTEFASETQALRNNFLSRNRIIAGLSDVTVVVESALAGGALVTAQNAREYKRKVFAVPGRVTDTHSQGCNALINKGEAQMLESPEALDHAMNWTTATPTLPRQQSLLLTLNPDQKQIIDLLTQNREINLDELCNQTNWPISKMSALLIELEFAGHIRALAGKRFTLN